MSTIIGLVSTFRLPLQEVTQKSKKDAPEDQIGIPLAPNLAKGGAAQLSGKEKPSRVY